MSAEEYATRRPPIIQWKKAPKDDEAIPHGQNEQATGTEQQPAPVEENVTKKPFLQWRRETQEEEDIRLGRIVQTNSPAGIERPASTVQMETRATAVNREEPVSRQPVIEEKPKAKFGTREISDISANIQVGCSNDCKYCYAAHRAVSGGYVKGREMWGKDILKSSQPIFNRKYDGVVMYPTTHDITRRLLNSHCQAISEILEAGNDLVICSKARLECLQRVAKVCAGYKDKVTFMVTITTLDEGQSVFWEPNAPLPCERLAALEFLRRAGFRTSVIVEPLLQGPCSALGIYQAVSPYVTEAIWIGTMNMIDERVDVSNPDNVRAVDAIKRYHSIDNLRFLYENMKDLPKVRFKSSITRIFERKSEA